MNGHEDIVGEVFLVSLSRTESAQEPPNIIEVLIVDLDKEALQGPIGEGLTG